MSLASAQRNLATKNRELLQESAQIKLTQSVTQGIGETLGAAAGFVGEQMDVDENASAWESVEAGREYLGMDKDSIPKPSLRQKWFKKPSSMIGGTLKVDDKTEISLGNLQSLGTLAKSDNRSLYESIAGDAGLKGAYTSKRKSNAELQKMDASGAYSNQTGREKSPYMGNITEGSSSYDTLKQAMPGGFSENKAQDMSLPDSNATGEDIQTQINKGYANVKPNKEGEAFDPKSVGQNYYKLMAEGTTPEAGQSYYDALIARREELRGETKELGN
jgi:hypothetical protein